MLKKEQLLAWIHELGESIGKEDLSELFQDDTAQGDKKIGHGQFRELASLCSAAECYEEIELLVKYNTAKAKSQKSWAKECFACKNKKFGDLIIEYMRRIKETEPNDTDVLKDLMHFFGYLYWQSRVWSMENPSQSNGNGKFYGNNKHGTDFSRDRKPNNGYGKPNPQHKGGYR
ncbi:MAG: hypothetical protein IKI45_13470 [Oscillospiraceae bacterium]|nr:hypothetical protein [Oscillospiraceae bacterium]